jgi:hypothetical protein
MLVAGQNDNKIRALDLNAAAVTTVAGTGVLGGADGPLNNNTLTRPVGIDYDPSRRVAYFSEYMGGPNGQKIRLLEMWHPYNVRTLAGIGPAGFLDGVGTSAKLNNGHCLVLSPLNASVLFFADTGCAAPRQRAARARPQNWHPLTLSHTHNALTLTPETPLYPATTLSAASRCQARRLPTAGW